MVSRGEGEDALAPHLRDPPVGVEGAWQRRRQQHRTDDDLLVKTKGANLLEQLIEIHRIQVRAHN